MNVQIKSKLKELIAESGLNNKELAERTGVSAAAIGRLASDRSSQLHMTTLEKIAGYFQIKSLDELFEIREKP